MFKNLRDRLKKVQDDLEENLDAQLEAQLEAELAEAVAKARGDSEAGTDAPVETVPSADEQPIDTPAEPEAIEEPVPETEPTEAEEPEPLAPEQPDAVPEPMPVESTPDPIPAEEAPTVEVPAAIEEPEIVPEPEPVPVAEPVAEPVVEPVAEPTPPATTPPAPTPPKPVITGRKQLTEQEIEARLARELGEAVEVQKEVEQAASPSSVTKYTINEDILEDILWELEVGLLESDVALPVVEAIKENIKDQLLSLQIGGRSPSDVVEKVLKSAIKRVLSGQTLDFDALVRERVESGRTPFVVMFVGVNGTGKTTSIARIAHRLQKQGYAPVLAAGDTFRAGAIEQLTQHADKLGVKIIKHSAGADPAAVAYDAIEHAKARNKPVVLLDTAGRMQTNTNLMDEMDKIRRVAKPDLTLFVGDSLAGNDAVEQARRFDEVVDIDGAILTKVDVDAKGGAALSVAYTINKPLVFVGIGQGYEDLIPFDAGWLVDRLFGDES